jgi:hypothetical protein
MAITSSVHRFVYRPERVDAGAVYEYVKSNIDGSHAIRVLVHVASAERIEVLKLEPENGSAAYVVAHMNWLLFSAQSLDAWVVFPDGRRRPSAHLEHEQNGALLHVRVGDRSEDVHLSHYPFHVYNFDFISLSQCFRHMIEPESDFKVDVVDPVFEPGSGHVMVDKGTASIEYGGHELRRGTACWRYRVRGPAFGGAEGLMWVNRDHGWVEDIEIPIPDNPGWNSFKFELHSVNRQNEIGWQQKMDTEISLLV